jgi:hypothetical protein
MDIIVSLEESRLRALLRSVDMLFPLLSVLHVVAMGSFLGAIMLLDLRVIGLFRSVSLEAAISLVMPPAIVMLAVAVISGAALFLHEPRLHVSNPAFIWKVALIAASSLATPTVRTLAGASLAVWVSVAALGKLMAFL